VNGGGNEQLSSEISEPPQSGVGEPPSSGEHASDDERAELERLRAEVSELRDREQARGDGTGEGTSGTPPRARRGRWHAPVSALVLTLACVLAIPTVITVWEVNLISNTDRYVATMAPLINEPPIQAALSAKITTQITDRLDVKSLTTQAAAQLQAAHLPRLATLVTTFQGQIVSGVNSAVAAGVSKAVASPAVETLWVQANRIAHQGIVKVLSGSGNGALSVVNDQVVLNLGPIIAQVKEYLVAHGLSVASNIPTVNATFPLFEAKNLSKAQQAYRLDLTLKWVLPLLVLIFLAVGIYVARSRRRALMGAMLGLATAMLFLGIALQIVRAIYLNSVPSTTLPPDAAAVLYDTLVRFLRQGLRVVAVVALVIAIAAFFVGPSRGAVRARRAVRSGIDWVRTLGERAGLRTGPVGEWTGAHKTILRIGAIALVGLIFVFWGQPTVAVVIVLVVVLVLLLGIIELIAARPDSPAEAAPQSPQ
jgi:hypothetical protein